MNSNHSKLLEMTHSHNVSSASELPDSLRVNTLFQISDFDEQSKILQSHTKELKLKLNALNQQLELVQNCTKLKQKRLHQFKEKEEVILEFEVKRHQREEKWEKDELCEIKLQEEKITEFKQYVIDHSELLINTTPTIGRNINEEQNKKKSKKKSKFSRSKYLTKKETYDGDMVKRTLSNSTPAQSTPQLFNRNYSVPTVPSPEILSKTHSETDTSSTSDFDDESETCHSSEDFNLSKEESIELYCERQMLRRKLNLAEERLSRLQEQLDYRKKHSEIVSKSSTAASKVTSDLIQSINKKRLETLEEIRDLHKSENTILFQLDKLSTEIKTYQEFLITKQKQQLSHNNNSLQNQSSTTNNNKVYPSISFAFSDALHAFQNQHNILLERLMDVRPHIESMTGKNTENIWKEAAVSTGNNKTVIFATDKEKDSESNEDRIQFVRAGTLNQLVMKLTDEKRQNLNFVKTFITTFRSFTTPDLLFQKIVERYDVPRDQQSDIPDEQWKQNVVLPIQIRVCNVIRNWLDIRFSDFEYKLMQKVFDFIDNRLRNDGHGKHANSLSAIIKRKILQRRNESLTTLEHNKVETWEKFPKKMEFEFFIDQPAKVFADFLTFVDSKLYCAIQSNELIDHQNSKSRCPNMTKMIERFNFISNWVAYMIVSRKMLADRINCVSKFIEIAVCLRELNNFNGLLSIIGGLNNSAVHRLKKTREGVPANLQQQFEELCAVMKSANSYKSYREVLHSICPPVVPYVGIYLQDLTFINDGNPNTIEGLINFRKRELIYRVIEEFQQYQQVSYTIPLDLNLKTYFASMLKTSEDKLFELSYQAEPK